MNTTNEHPFQNLWLFKAITVNQDPSLLRKEQGKTDKENLVKGHHQLLDIHPIGENPKDVSRTEGGRDQKSQKKAKEGHRLLQEEEALVAEEPEEEWDEMELLGEEERGNLIEEVEVTKVL